MAEPTTTFIFLTWMIPAAYLLGSIPTAVWTGRLFHGIDVREHGSGNAGATNVMRVLGVRTGVPVLLIDMVKGWAAVRLVYLQASVGTGEETFMMLSILMGMLAVTGHIFPVFAGFRGGKGVATIGGVCLALHPAATAAALGVFILVLLLSQYVSLGSVSAGISFPVWVIVVFNSPYISLSIFSLVAAMLLVITHRKNISRLRAGEENRATFLFRKKQ
jgi:glycerol-3-phosphate acyltransferase PlsY